MITLITGVPGSGKTLYCVGQLAKKIHTEYKDKKIYVDGITDLKIDVCPIPDGQSINNFNEWAPLPENRGEDGALVIIDEAQRIFPPRSSGSSSSALVEWLHVHRHAGVDIILITQKPMRIDKQVRDLVGAHYHIHKNALGVRVIYFWDYCADNPKSEMKNGKPSIYKLDKKVFNLYKSAEVHTKVKTPKSRVLFFLPLSIIGLVFCLYLTFATLKNWGSADVEKTVDTSVAHVEQSTKRAAKDAGSQLDKNRPLTEEMLQPLIPDRVESKPLYDQVRQVRTFEYPVACISGGSSGCTCYTHQGTAIKEINKKTCRTYVKDGLPFNPYKERENAQIRPSEPVLSANPYSDVQVLSMGGKSQQNLMYDGYVQAGGQFR